MKGECLSISTSRLFSTPLAIASSRLILISSIGLWLEESNVPVSPLVPLATEIEVIRARPKDMTGTFEETYVLKWRRSQSAPLFMRKPPI